MGIISFIVLAVILGVIVWLVTTYLPIPAPIKTIIIVAVCILLVLVLMRAMGVLNYDPMIPQINDHR